MRAPTGTARRARTIVAVLEVEGGARLERALLPELLHLGARLLALAQVDARHDERQQVVRGRVLGFVCVSHAAIMGDAGRAVVMDENEEGGDSNTPSKPGGLPKR